MKSKKQTLSLAGILGLLLLAACNKESEPTASTQEPGNESAPAVVATPAGETANAVKEMIPAAEEVIESVQKEVEQAQSAGTAALEAEKESALQVIQSVKDLISQAKYTEALAALSSLSIDQLNPELQGLATQLKDQAEKALASTAAGKAGETINNVLKENNIKLENPFKK